jgi:N-methylhydantoinase A
VRYVGQSYELGVRFGAEVAARFHTAHRRLYGYADPGRPIEVVNVRLLATGRGIRPRHAAYKPEPPLATRPHRMHWAGRVYRALTYQRDHLAVGRPVRGPAVICEFSATAFVPPGWLATIHRTGHMVLTRAH